MKRIKSIAITMIEDGSIVNMETVSLVEKGLLDIELRLEKSLNIPIKAAASNTTLRLEQIVKLLKGLGRPVIVEYLPNLLFFIKESDCNNIIKDLLKELLHEAPEEIIEIMVHLGDVMIKKLCLQMLKQIFESSCAAITHKAVYSLTDVLNDCDKEISQTARDVVKMFRDSIFRNQEFTNYNKSTELIFGIIPLQLVNELYSNQPRKIKYISLKSIEEILCNLKDLSLIAPHHRELIEFLNHILISPHTKFVVSGLKICAHLSQKYSWDLSLLNAVLKSKLGDSSIEIRQLASQILFQNLRFSNSLLSDIISNLNNENWHIREEVLKIIIAGLLTKNKFEGIDILNILCKRLDDDKSKVRQVAIEALVVLGKDDSNALINKLKPLVDEIALKNISYRLEIGSAAVLVNNQAHLPLISSAIFPVSYTSRYCLSPIARMPSINDASSNLGFSSIHASSGLRTSSLNSKFPSTSSLIKKPSGRLKPSQSSKKRVKVTEKNK